MPGCIVSAMTASFRSVEKRRRRATPVITSTFENVSDIGVCLGLYLGPPAKAGVRSKRGAVHKLKPFRIRLSIDQNEIGPNVAIAKVLPFAGKSMIEIAPRQQVIISQKPYGFRESSIECTPMPTRFFSPIISFEPPSVPNDPH